MKLEDNGVTAEFEPGFYNRVGADPDTVVFTDGENTVAVTVDLLRLAWHAWA